MLTVGIGIEAGGFSIPLRRHTVPGVALAAFLGVVLNFVLPKESEGRAIDSPDFDADLRAEAATTSGIDL